MGIWTHLIFEAYCSYSWSKDKYVQYRLIQQDEKGKLIRDNKGNFKTDVLPKRLNTFYNPKHRRPNWCKRKNKDRKPQPDCYLKGCPFLIMDPVNEKDYKTMLKAWEKTIKKH